MFRLFLSSLLAQKVVCPVGEKTEFSFRVLRSFLPFFFPHVNNNLIQAIFFTNLNDKLNNTKVKKNYDDKILEKKGNTDWHNLETDKEKI